MTRTEKRNADDLKIAQEIFDDMKNLQMKVKKAKARGLVVRYTMYDYLDKISVDIYRSFANGSIKNVLGASTDLKERVL